MSQEKKMGKEISSNLRYLDEFSIKNDKCYQVQATGGRGSRQEELTYANKEMQATCPNLMRKYEQKN